MAISDAVQTLSAAFSFGILLQAATGALIIYFRGHGSTIFKDGRRLVLVLFLLFAALWAQVDFLNLLILKPTLCQVTLVFSSAFDQLARFSLEQFLVWMLAQRTKMNAGQMILQAILGFRLIAGGTLVGFTRPDFAPVCIARTSVEPVAIVVIAFDFLIIGVLIIRSKSVGMFRDMRDPHSSTRDQSRGLMLTIIGFTVWTSTSVAMILGVPTIILIVRTVVPANGLLILVGILTFFAGSLLDVREEIITPEAHSPFVTPSVASREIFRENPSNGSPIFGHTYSKSGSLFVVNPSSTPNSSTTGQGYYQDALGSSKFGEEVTVRNSGAGEAAPRDLSGYRGSSGVFPTMVTASMKFNQGALAPQIRPNIIDSTQNVSTFSAPNPIAQQKRSFFSRSKQPVNSNIRSLKISKPVMEEEPSSVQQPFAKIQTIDLAQAAVNERERREAAAERSRLVANRPAPQPPQRYAMPATEALRKSIRVKRREVPASQSHLMPTITRSPSSALSLGATNGSTTSSSLSPGREEVRRRSPRNANGFDESIDEKAKPTRTLQRKQTIGLPSNPRSTKMAPIQSLAKDQTVILMKDIVYDHPGIVKTIVNGAPEMYALAQKAESSAKTPSTFRTLELKSGGSIIHRPRPYRKTSDVDRALFPSEPSPRHWRTKSGGSITSQKSVLMPYPGSPTELPPLPAPPTSAAKLQRLLPNDTKSMTFDEKIQLLFPAPPGASTIYNRRSSVPSLPRLPSAFISETPLMQSPTQEEQQSKRASKRTTIASFGLLDHAESLEDDRTKTMEPQAFRYSANAYRDLTDQLGETWVPVREANVGSLAPDVTDMGSHILHTTRKSDMIEINSSNMSTDDDFTTYWESIHSEIPPIDLSKVMRNANSTFIQRSLAATVAEFRPAPSPEEHKFHHGEETMTVMLECEEGCPSIVTSPVDNRQSFFLDADQSLAGDTTPIIVKTWHRRIGDELPTFSERKISTRPRKMPPPTPLLLNNRGRGARVVVRGAEPSPPIDSPQRAIAEIQAQLKRFEEPTSGSVGSLLRRIPDTATADENAANQDRFKLLENLENEMGQQESQWQQMQTDLQRKSTSTMATPGPPADSETETSRASSRRSSRTPSIAASRRARIRSSMTVRSKGDDSMSTTSSQSSDNSRASIWQQRLAEAQMEYMENAPALLQSVNFLSVSKSHQLGSPTPPDSIDSGTDMETDSETESENGQIASATNCAASLWQHDPSLFKAATGRMWDFPYKMIKRATSPEPPAKTVRPAQRLTKSSLHITSSDLWSKSASAVKGWPVVGLWGSKLVKPIGIRTRPITQRPLRKSKRVTILPDILPLPNRRDTLGIFQFPWGETSDSAVYQPAFNSALLSGPILNAKLEARSHQLEPEAEYSSSFFDDYDEDIDEDEEIESDDDFDETTLWEIASLLRTENVPSKNSLLPPARDINEFYDEGDDTEFEEDEEAEELYQAKKVAQLPTTKLPIMPLAMSSKRDVKQSSLPSATDLATTSEVAETGLFQSEPQVWQINVLAVDDSGSASPAVLSPGVAQISNFLWRLPSPKTEQRSSGLFSPYTQRSGSRNTQVTPAVASTGRTPRPSNASLQTLSSNSLWTPEQIFKQETKVWTSVVSVKAPVRSMWIPAPTVKSVAITGLFSTAHPRINYRTTDLLPAAQKLASKPRRPSIAPLPRLTSTKLWSASGELPFEHHWISESSIRPTSPSVYSESSSVGSSPVSETSSISGASFNSTGTKASSLWGSVQNATTLAWSKTKSSRKTPSPPLVDNLRFASKLPVLHGKGLESVRESRVLASRDVWELRGPVALGDAPKRNFTVKKSTIPPRQQETAEHHPIHQKFRSNTASNTNWDEATKEAIAAGTPKKTLSRPVASNADWEAALQLAISKSIIPEVAAISRYNHAVRHSVFFTESLVSSTSDIHPAAIGHAEIKDPRHDPSVLHSVFFTSTLLASATDIHPAAIGHVKIPLPKSLWIAPHFHISALEAPIGPMWRKGKVAAPQFEHDKTPSIRRNIVSPDAPLSHLQSSNTWQHQPAPVLERNWILLAKRTQTYTWTATKRVIEEENKDMWAPKAVKASSVDLFAHHTNTNVKRARSGPGILPRLNSTELFTTASITSDRTHWLHSTSISQVRIAPGEGMWLAPKKGTSLKKNERDVCAHIEEAKFPEKLEDATHSLHSTTSSSSSNLRPSSPVTVAPKIIARSHTWSAKPFFEVPGKDKSNMWIPRPAQIVVHSPGIFTNAHGEPWARKKRADYGVEVIVEGALELESKQMWSRRWVMPESPREWLKPAEKTVSKVQFRY
ncbi:hypothetical protein D0Z07_3635 [Hyphodiscus hymeniophilus]|uniref:Uncharacterized protein n=1 Tax=Hyphodiscus hymeniophilus TaxID=353542 RepID=A0A9P6VLN6_9HELO|nr:hypothetical protein D0Z07_3635 [Hyphodiscus hymeniophilus]